MMMALAGMRDLPTVLVPGGVLVFDFLNAAARSSYVRQPDHKTLFTPQEMRDLAERAGFSTIRSSGRPERRARLLIARA